MAISNIHLTHTFARSNNIKLVFAIIVLILESVLYHRRKVG